MDEHQKRQAKLDSVDYLMVILTRLGICSEYEGMKIFQSYRQRIFYRRFIASQMQEIRIEQILNN